MNLFDLYGYQQIQSKFEVSTFQLKYTFIL
jgi:hypothetical protein